MGTDRNLLVGVLAMQARLIDSAQFLEACALWTTRKQAPLIDLLIERGWIREKDVGPLEYLMRRNLEAHGDDATVTLRDVGAQVRRQLAKLQDPEITRCLTNEARSNVADATPDAVVEPDQRYKPKRLHATGGIGQIWVVNDVKLGREIALKELRSDKARSEGLLKRFLREARITAQLEHPGIVPVYELASRPDNQQPFYTMRFVNGRTLTEAARIHHQKRASGQPPRITSLSEADTLEMLTLLNSFITVCNTIGYAHSLGVIHRDLKGQNVLLGNFGEVVVVDWGLAKLIDEPDQPSGEFSNPLDEVSPDRDLTVEGQMIGTPAYMAPEQAAGYTDRISQRTDVYGLGAILYEILTGQPPFAGSNTREVLRKVREGEPVSPREFWPEVPPALESACLRALSKQPQDRYGSATELAQEIQKWQEVQRKQAEEERDRFFNLSLDMLCVASFDGHVIRLNPAFQRVLGFTIEELRARPFLEFVHPEDRQATIDELDRLYAGADAIFFENRYRCKDGSYRWMQWNSTPDFDRQLIHSAARDITERKHIEVALKDSEERYRSVVAAMEDGIVILDASGGIRSSNASAERILGLSAEQMMGRTSLDPGWQAIHEDGSAFPGDTFPAAVTLRTGEPCSHVMMGLHKPSGELTWISINSQPLFRPGEAALAGVVASFTDVTARKQNEEALAEAKRQIQELKRRVADDSDTMPATDVV